MRQKGYTTPCTIFSFKKDIKPPSLSLGRDTIMRKTVNDKIQSGVKFRTKNGVTAIKDGIKVSKNSGSLVKKKPDWLRVKIPTGGKYQTVNEIVKSHNLSTVCEESHCPNIGECWSHGTATIMLMGSVCTRACRFCSCLLYTSPSPRDS